MSTLVFKNCLQEVLLKNLQNYAYVHFDCLRQSVKVDSQICNYSHCHEKTHIFSFLGGWLVFLAGGVIFWRVAVFLPGGGIFWWVAAFLAGGGILEESRVW